MINEEIQVDYTTVCIEEYKEEDINIIYLDTGYGEREIPPTRDAERMKWKVENACLCLHRSPKAFSAGLEFGWYFHD